MTALTPPAALAPAGPAAAPAPLGPRQRVPQALGLAARAPRAQVRPNPALAAPVPAKPGPVPLAAPQHPARILLAPALPVHPVRAPPDPSTPQAPHRAAWAPPRVPAIK